MIKSTLCPDCHEEPVAVIDDVIQECRACAASRIAARVNNILVQRANRLEGLLQEVAKWFWEECPHISYESAIDRKCDLVDRIERAIGDHSWLVEQLKGEL